MIHIYGSVLAKLQQCVLVTLSGSLDFQFKKKQLLLLISNCRLLMLLETLDLLSLFVKICVLRKNTNQKEILCDLQCIPSTLLSIYSYSNGRMNLLLCLCNLSHLTNYHISS